MISVDRFLERCSQSSSAAFAAFTELLSSLKSPDTQLTARQFFDSVYRVWRETNQEHKYYFSFVTQVVKTYEGDRRELKLLLFPSIFAPEEWSLTFYEGLLRYPAEEFYSRRVVELGCGSGWITLAIALNSLPQVIYGVDLNPRAVVCSQLNLYFNALDDAGNPIFDSECKTLIDRVEFAQSDLLEYFRPIPEKIATDRPTSPPVSSFHPLDHVIGCIPQVLNPELEIMRDLIQQESNDEFLHSLSNYCEKQGYIEDRFGLGLLAKAIEQSIKLLRPTGKVIFNFGGRPGVWVLERLMTRRGLEVRQIWQTKVEQDSDTDISGLVEIERATGHRFEFFITPRSNIPISAATAWAYSQHGGKIYHSVSVYEGALVYPSWLKQIFQILEQPNLQEVKTALDLTENDADVAEERFYWLASLFNYLDRCSYLPYGLTGGEIELCERVAAYFRNYYSIPWDLANLVITPSRETAIANLLTVYSPQLITIDAGLRQLLPANCQRQIIETPRSIPLTCKLITKLRPTLIITGLDALEITSTEPFASLVNTAQEIGALLVVDISQNLNLSSHPVTNGLFEYLADVSLPANVILLADLIKNRLYPDLSLCIGVTTCPQLRENLVRAAELTYSRVPLITQFFYQQLLEQLLHFQTARLQPNNNNLLISHTEGSFRLQRSPAVSQAFNHPAIGENELPFTPSTIRLDCGENCLPSPNTLLKAIAEAFARQEIAPEECDLHHNLSLLFAQRYGINYADRGNFAYGSGVASLFNAIVQQCRQQAGTFIFPQGAYGYFRAALDFYGVPVNIAPGDETRGFKLDLSTLEQILANTTNSWLYLNAPISNPTGALYSSLEIQAIVELAWQYQAIVVLDTIFAGLEFESQNLDLSWLQDRRRQSTGNIILLGGISKEFSAAGMRFGYLYSPRGAMVKQLAAFIPSRLPQTTMYAMNRFFDRVVSGDAAIAEHGEFQRQLLQQRAIQLTEVLQQSGWTPIIPQGGLFLVAKPTAFLDKTISNDQQEIAIDGDSITTVLFNKIGLTINSATWTGLPDYCRFVLSVTETEFQAALQRIRQVALLQLKIKN
ncbi:MAG: aminotransferase class I/II-fold pyridoxal phosphate-dependent enzyme [Pleurocapsa sp.]